MTNPTVPIMNCCSTCSRTTWPGRNIAPSQHTRKNWKQMTSKNRTLMQQHAEKQSRSRSPREESQSARNDLQPQRGCQARVRTDAPGLLPLGRTTGRDDRLATRTGTSGPMPSVLEDGERADVSVREDSGRRRRREGRPRAEGGRG